MSRILLTLLTLAVLFSAPPASAADNVWQVGVAKVEITPDSPLWMAGYAARNRPAEGKLTPLWAKALVLEDAQQHRAVLITLDLVGIDRELALAMRGAIAEKLKLEPAQVMICTSHTHSGPVVAQNLRPMHYLLLDDKQQRLVMDYARLLKDSVVQLATVARRRMEPCTLHDGSGHCTFAVNRRNNNEAEVPELRKANKLVGPVDHDVPVLAARDAAGQLKAVVFGYACHGTVLDGYDWCGDYPGYAQLALEAKHDGAIALFWAGCGGDQNPIPRRQVELAKSYGDQLAAAVDDVLAKELPTLPSRLATDYVEIDLSFATLPTRAEFESQAQDKNRYIASRAKYFLAELDAGRAVPTSYPYPIAAWKLGDKIDWLFLGGEVVVDYALRLKSERHETHTWVTGYSNDVMAYIPSRRVLLEGGYEGGGAMVYYGRPAVWAETVEEQIVNAVKKLQ
jgi:hypothetical protein